ncbi:hypothetical protein CPB84DRAFT_1748748 [Gymnopilus junonius]|uniref:Uncharacterized protein n=1 Tax=Gymnopilus junonius TaxID=109634 RepID=A0A9P5TLQ3_GYMJU|nr:hypothetical protein CPB84DRAFT_1748748 [Gymnopilus junonius]
MTEDLSKRDFPLYESPFNAFPPVSMWPRKSYEAFPVGKNYDNFMCIIQGSGISIPETEEERQLDGPCRTAVYKRIYNEAHCLVARRARMKIKEGKEEKIMLLLGTPDEDATLKQEEALAKLMGLRDVFSLMNKNMSRPPTSSPAQPASFLFCQFRTLSGVPVALQPMRKREIRGPC